MTTGEIVAVKMLATNSKQGEKEFQIDVTLSNLQVKFSVTCSTTLLIGGSLSLLLNL